MRLPTKPASKPAKQRAGPLKPAGKRAVVSRWQPAIVCLMLLPGCYYTQAITGQIDVLSRREPIADVIGDPETPESLARRLRLVQEARRFSIVELGLPDNDSYRTYADLERDFVVWNIFATPEFSLQPKRWCYPIVGCVSYRGYFRREAAERFAARLDERSYDVHMGGVSAYSTLGRFDDPILNTMMRWDDIQLVSVLFHELAHQVLYIKGDTQFNESFATAVEEIGVERFLAARPMDGALEAYTERKQLRRDMTALVEAAREDLGTYYSETIDDDEKRLLKEHRIEKLTSDLRAVLERYGRDADAFLRVPFNNARIASFNLYEGRLAEFRALSTRCGGELDCFYAEAIRISELDKDERDAALDELQSNSAVSAPPVATLKP